MLVKLLGIDIHYYSTIKVVQQVAVALERVASGPTTPYCLSLNLLYFQRPFYEYIQLKRKYL